jgi:AcrR family transcriptional regulator
MGTRERRAREFRQREDYLLDLATDMLLEQGQDAVTMERLAERSEYAKGTLYKHFGCREDLLCALTTRRMGKISGLFQQALTFPGTTRARLIASLMTYELYAARHPEEFSLLIALVSGPLSHRASQDHFQKLEQAQAQLFQVLRGLFAEAREAGDLPALPMDQDPFSFGLWSLVFGNYVLGNADPQLCGRLGVHSMASQLHSMVHLVLDGAGWKPLSTDCDYRRLTDDIHDFLLQALPELGEGDRR